MSLKRGGRKGQLISLDFILAFVIFITIFSIFSYYIFALENRVFVQQSFLREAHYNFNIFEQNAANAGFNTTQPFHLQSDIPGLEDLPYEELKFLVLNNTRFERDNASLDVCLYMVDRTEARLTLFHAGKDDENITLNTRPCGDGSTQQSPFPECHVETYQQGFSATRFYFYNETKQTVALTLHLCRKTR